MDLPPALLLNTRTSCWSSLTHPYFKYLDKLQKVPKSSSKFQALHISSPSARATHDLGHGEKRGKENTQCHQTDPRGFQSSNLSNSVEVFSGGLVVFSWFLRVFSEWFLMVFDLTGSFLEIKQPSYVLGLFERFFSPSYRACAHSHPKVLRKPPPDVAALQLPKRGRFQSKTNNKHKQPGQKQANKKPGSWGLSRKTAFFNND